MRQPTGVVLAALAAVAAPAQAHFNMLMPQTPSAKKGEEVVFVYQWGHPYEHELFDAPPPDSVVVLSPDGQDADVTESLEKIGVPAGDGKKVAAYQFRFTPDQRGDYVFLLQTPPVWMAEDDEFLQDNVKVVLHVQAQKGWDGAVHTEFELMPLTRPYGLEPGMAFRAELQDPEGRPNARAAILRNPLAGAVGRDRALSRRPAQDDPGRRVLHAHGQDRPQRRRHGHLDRSGLVVSGGRGRRRNEGTRRQELSGSAAQHLLGLRR